MTLTSQILATRPGWRARDVQCGAGPQDPAYEEQHDGVCMAIVLDGTFEYRCSRGRAALAPGAILLGVPGEPFECGHDHSIGDRCLSFHLDAEVYERMLAGIPGARRFAFATPSIPPAGGRAHLLAAADAALDDPLAAEELLHQLTAAVAQAGVEAGDRIGRTVPIAARVREIAHSIEEDPTRPHSLSELAERAAVSPCHLLREFKREIGVTPYQFVLLLRLRRAARLLRGGGRSVLDIALAAGFSDLSEFNRRFRRAMSMTPGEYRRRARDMAGRR